MSFNCACLQPWKERRSRKHSVIGAAWVLALAALASPMPATAQDGDGLEPEAAAPITGQALALDGDTLQIGKVRIRLWGVDAPEMSAWPWGPLARAELDIWTRIAPVTCHPKGKSHNRIVAQCFVRLGDDREPIDLAQKMIYSGYAVEYRSFTGGHYVTVEERARYHRLGVWDTKH